jgi:phenylacetic acid degradation operon negative regulatory protein
VVLSVLLGSDPPRLPTQLLVRTTELFGIAEGTTRTALSRMVAAGDLVAEGGRYALAPGRLVARQARQAASRAATTRPWTAGRWRMVVLGADGARAREERAEVRTALAAARLAELREGVWLRPDNLDVEPVPGARSFLAEPDGDGAALAASLWDLDGWAKEADDLRQQMAALVGRLEAGDTGALREGFVLSAAVLRQFQHDPLLPADLLPPRWPGAALRADYDRYDAAYRTVLATWFGANRR